MSKWNHSICETCWKKQNPDREPIVIKPQFRDEETCCSCSLRHFSGIYVRSNPADMPCNGVHIGDAEAATQ
jgi:hypothetical protein